MKKQTGFTIVELLIVIVVIGILAAITIVAFNGIQDRAKNTSRINELAAWQKMFELYRAENGNFPAQANAQYCLGYGFPTGSNSGGVARCRDYNGTSTSAIPESTNDSLMTELKKVGSLPSGLREPVNGTVGPYITYETTYITLQTIIKGAPTDCPTPTRSSWTDNNGRTICYVTLTR